MIYDPNTGQWAQRPAPDQNTAPGGLATGAYGTFLRTPDARQTVQGQMIGLLKSDSPYMKINEQKGQQFAASRGLLNSTLAGQAGRRAAIEGAMPIAAADATTFAQAGAQNQDSLNRMAALDLQRQAATATAVGGGGGYNALDEETRFEREKEMMRLQSQLRREERGEDRAFERETRDMEFADRGLDRAWRADQSAQDRGLTREQWIAEAEQRALDRGLTREEWLAEEASRERDREWRAGQSSLDRDLTREQWMREFEERARDRDWRSGESALDRDFQRGMSREEWAQRAEQSALDRGLTREQWDREYADRALDRAWRSDQAAQDRGLTREQWEQEAEQNALNRGLTQEQWIREEAENERNREFERNERLADRQFQLNSMSTQARFELFGNVLGMAMGTMMSSPDFFRDPDGAAGFINFFAGDVFGGLFDRFFGGGSSTPPGGG